MAEKEASKEERKKFWYLDLMAPSTKGANFAWLDPSTIYANGEAFDELVNDLVLPFCDDPIDFVVGIDIRCDGVHTGSSHCSAFEERLCSISQSGASVCGHRLYRIQRLLAAYKSHGSTKNAFSGKKPYSPCGSVDRNGGDNGRGHNTCGKTWRNSGGDCGHMH